LEQLAMPTIMKKEQGMMQVRRLIEAESLFGDDRNFRNLL
jgi:hypothetical protein